VKIDQNARRAAFQFMPITFQSLVIESTSQCNAACGMCYQSAGPNGSDTRGKATLSLEQIKILLHDGMRIKTLNKNFHLTGGEAFLNLFDCIELFNIAREAGYAGISTTTNAYWATTRYSAKKICSTLRQAGLTQMEISWDFWHQPYISSDAISNALEGCYENGIRSVLRLLSSKSHPVTEALTNLRRSSLPLATEIYSTPVYPIGRSKLMIDSEEIYYTGDLSATCNSILNLTVNPWGNVYPCCAGSEETEWLSFGNIKESSIIDISEYMNSSLMLRTLVFLGVGVLVSILEKAGVSMNDNYSNICHLCFEIFSKPDNARIIHQYFENLEKNAILNSLSYFDNDYPFYEIIRENSINKCHISRSSA
jgi:MoaA/NifB/PqqE/SkfB family radical SAM enzyme